MNISLRSLATVVFVGLAAGMTVIPASAAMLLEYKFDGSGTNTGTTGAANNLVLEGSGTGTPTFTGPTSPFESTGASLDNSSLTYGTTGQDYLLGGMSNTTFAGGTGFTLTGWVDMASAPQSGSRIIDKGGSAAGGFTLQFAGASLNFQVSNGTSLLSGTSTVNSFGATLSTWQWFGVTYDPTSGNISFYTLDASNQVTLVNTAATAGGAYVNNSTQVRLANTSGGNRALDGYLDDFRLFDEVQTVSQMQTLAVPEPSAFGLALAAGLVLAAARKAKRASA